MKRPQRTSRNEPYTRAGAVTIRRPDGTTETQAPYQFSDFHRILRSQRHRGRARSGDPLEIVVRFAAPCLLCGTQLNVGRRARFWPGMGLTCLGHDPKLLQRGSAP